MKRTAASTALLVGATLLAATRAGAQAGAGGDAPIHAEAEALPRSGARSSRLPRIDLVLVGGRDMDAFLLQDRIESWFREEGAEWTVRRAERLSADALLAIPTVLPVVRVWIVLGSSPSRRTIRLFFCVQATADPNPRYLARDVALDRGFDELGIERVAQLVYPSALALWEGHAELSRRTMEDRVRSELEEPIPSPRGAGGDGDAPPATAPERCPLAWSPGVLYAVRSRGDEPAAHGPGVVFGLHTRCEGVDWGGRLSTQLLLPQRMDLPGVQLELSGWSFRIGPSLRLRGGPRTLVVGELGMGADTVEVRVTSTSDSGLRAADEAIRIRPFAFLSIGASADLGHFRIGAAAAAFVQLTRTHYDVRDASRTSEQAAPWIVQPALTLEAGWE